jgi:hypothetical protein
VRGRVTTATPFVPAMGKGKEPCEPSQLTTSRPVRQVDFSVHAWRMKRALDVHLFFDPSAKAACKWG